MTDWEEIDESLEEMMIEPPGGDNHGSSYHDISTAHGVTGATEGKGNRIVYAVTHPHRPTKSLNIKDTDALRATQRTVYDPKEYYYLGMTAHRGILQPEEYVDKEAVVFALEQRLGYKAEEVQFLYSKPNPSKKDLPRKDKLEDIFLELEEAGGNMSLLAALLGLQVRADGTCFTMARAIKRARERREASQ